jgi:hypothetical protein
MRSRTVGALAAMVEVARVRVGVVVGAGKVAVMDGEVVGWDIGASGAVQATISASPRIPKNLIFIAYLQRLHCN